MEAGKGRPRIIVGVDGSGASVQALRTAHALAGPLDAAVEAWACWDVPAGFGLYLAVGIDGFEFAAKQALQQALTDAFGTAVPSEIRGRLLRGSAAHLLIDGSREAALLVVGRHGHAGFVPGSVSSACVSHAHCPVLVVPARVEAADGGR
ncbi:UspA domain protein [Pseudarthrobacter chlorophenolicus A6]|uniref:UspA domain protein n=1 Tax=Pseudarthrobacter chlorophenolicus (strain ATCC 700700 / DSM 12829 / CIP 107037 / JCM 12360 / KCTC 9906 / NCIMB 13794 / A6) TaxID=452863 RepID=B8H9H6_PSECP|nr:universal stress protein [Pseudarthrobacter chlorophenolicus]ACL40045.1 UspA domain protein [Pseudarthrobacter chlorophenolicus A6]SDQ88954.1 Nucleotide-binding universal stress protein, UspA family [Pseudarthrobacter chlorophenolicus]